MSGTGPRWWSRAGSQKRKARAPGEDRRARPDPQAHDPAATGPAAAHRVGAVHGRHGEDQLADLQRLTELVEESGRRGREAEKWNKRTFVVGCIAASAAVLAVLVTLAVVPRVGGPDTDPEPEGQVQPETETDTDCDRTIAAADLGGALDTVDDGETVCVQDGTYRGELNITRRFTEDTSFRALNPYGVLVEHDSTVMRISGATNVTIEGFRLRHRPGGKGYITYIRSSDSGTTENVVIRNNVIHRSYDNDLLKVHNGARNVVMEDNVLYDPGPGEQHMDLNSAVDLVVRRNIMFHTQPAPRGERPFKHFIVIKGSNPGVGDVLGAERVTVEDNVFANFYGGVGDADNRSGDLESMISVGNDGKDYVEARDVKIDHNLFLANTGLPRYATLSVHGAHNVTFSNNQVLGAQPASYYGVRIGTKGDNPDNEDIVVRDNVFADPSGSIDDFGEVDNTRSFTLDDNIYWNGGKPVPVDGDANATVVDPGVPDLDDLVLPVWDNGFPSGSETIADEHARLVEEYSVSLERAPDA